MERLKKEKRNNPYEALSPGVGSYKPVFSAVAIIIDVVTIAGEFYPNLHQGQSQKIKPESEKDGVAQKHGTRFP